MNNCLFLRSRYITALLPLLFSSSCFPSDYIYAPTATHRILDAKVWHFFRSCEDVVYPIKIHVDTSATDSRKIV